MRPISNGAPIAPAGLAAGFALALTLIGVASAARAETAVPDQAALMVRGAVIAMAVADAAIPVAFVREIPAATASVKARPARNAGYASVSYERRYRSYSFPFPLILGVTY